MSNFVFIATSLDGFIARADGSIDWLEDIDKPANTDYGYNEFLEKIGAIVLGRKTYETALAFKAWPYPKPVFILSTTLKANTQMARGVRVLSKASLPMT
jgi:dihydrofolate reductase